MIKTQILYTIGGYRRLRVRVSAGIRFPGYIETRTEY